MRTSIASPLPAFVSPPHACARVMGMKRSSPLSLSPTDLSPFLLPSRAMKFSFVPCETSSLSYVSALLSLLSVRMCTHKGEEEVSPLSLLSYTSTYVHIRGRRRLLPSFSSIPCFLSLMRTHHFSLFTSML